MAGSQWPLPEPHKGWLLKSDLRKKALLESGLLKRWVSGPKLDKGLLRPELSKKWLLGPAPLEPMALGMKCKPWFKDRNRLPSCCFSRHKDSLGKCPTSMDSRRWVFVKEGVDDFRTGCPSPEDMITHGPREGFLPTIAHRIPRPPPKKIHRKPPKGADLGSKLSSAQRARKAFVLEVLDPDRELEDTWAYCEGTKERTKTHTQLCEKHPEEVNLEAPQAVNLEPPEAVNLEPPEAVNLEPPEAVNLEPPEAVNLEPPEAVNLEPPEAVKLEPPEAVNVESPWKFNLKPPEAENQEPPEEVNLKPEGKDHVKSAKECLQSYLFSLFPEEETKEPCTTDIPKVPVYQNPRKTVREFFKWIDDNFGDIGINEESIMKMFEIDFEGPLTHTTVKIKKISQLPLNIRPCKQLDGLKQRKFSLQEDNWERKLRKPPDPYKPKREKIRYGAWYLDPKIWTKLVNDAPLPDPKVVRDKDYWSYRRHLEPDIIDELYGPIAFKDFIVSKGYNMPSRKIQERRGLDNFLFTTHLAGDELYGPIAFKDFIVSKGYNMPSVIEKMFLRKGWKYESVKTPIHRVMKLLSKPKEEDSGEEED
ncbi:hypothetical protein QTO34_000798 [Cnephaeus nilssonii]|uniref:Protein FAM47A n=1 Tax=Cnephaeus nilssonii TaxID=3371016 RepID=A0AA40ICB8_CNENI|nr:hypothetical protein QTO34_000798 [Eptesicus nilssonii]